MSLQVRQPALQQDSRIVSNDGIDAGCLIAGQNDAGQSKRDDVLALEQRFPPFLPGGINDQSFIITDSPLIRAVTGFQPFGNSRAGELVLRMRSAEPSSQFGFSPAPEWNDEIETVARSGLNLFRGHFCAEAIVSVLVKTLSLMPFKMDGQELIWVPSRNVTVLQKVRNYPEPFTGVQSGTKDRPKRP